VKVDIFVIAGSPCQTDNGPAPSERARVGEN
jgi:hypothetical protein